MLFRSSDAGGCGDDDHGDPGRLRRPNRDPRHGLASDRRPPGVRKGPCGPYVPPCSSRRLLECTLPIPDVAMGTKTLLSGVLRLILLPVVIFYVLDDKEAIINKIKIIVPDKYEDLFSVIFREVDVALSQFVRGRILMALFVGVATMITLFLMGIEFALIIGVLTFVFDIVPYIGPFIGFVPAVLIAFFKSPIKALWVAFLFVFIQWLENNVIGPKILGSSIGLHPLVVLFSLIIGGGMFGVPGMIFAVPVIAVIKILYINILREYKINKNNKNNENKI